MQPDGTMKTSRTASCCSWSSSPGSTERHEDAGLVGPHPHREQPQRVVPLDELRADDAGVRPEGLLDELANRGGLERHVVVEEAEEPRALDELQRLVRGRSEPRVGVEPADVGPGKPGGDRCGHVPVAPRVDDEHREVRVVLSGERGQQLVEPCAGIVGNQHGDDRRRRLRLGLHNGPRLAAGLVRTGAHGGVEDPCAIDHKRLQLLCNVGSVASTSPQPRGGAMPISTPTFETLTKPAKDAFYVTVGLGAVAYEQLKSNQGELRSWFETQVADGKAQFETQASQIETRCRRAARVPAVEAARAGR